jgi:DNA processing protein
VNALKLSDQQLSKLMSGIVEENCNLGDAFASAVWSLITEPGDSFAAALSSALGPRKALEAELERFSAEQYSKLFTQVQLDEQCLERFRNFDSLLFDARERWQPRLKLSSVEMMFGVARSCKAKLINLENNFWPQQILDLKLGRPHCIWLRGEVSALASAVKSLAIVGARQSTNYGESVTSEIVKSASQKDLAIVSGGAYGIDAAAHRVALEIGVHTIAIMAGGVDRLYPTGNSELLGRVIRQGAVISEQAPGSNPTKWRFLQRNRLIAAVSSATVVVEAGKRSGAVNTAHHAVELNRPLGVVPGPINSPTSVGCLNLIRENPESLITSVQDAICLVTGEWQPDTYDELPIGPLETRALDAMGRSHSEALEIARRAGLTARELRSALNRLQLLGLVAQGERGWRKLT